MAAVKIGDTGMELPGAPKDRAKSILKDFNIEMLRINLADTLGIDADDLPTIEYDENDDVQHFLLDEWQSNLSKAKIWPTPDYAGMLEAGVPVCAVHVLKKLRDKMPNKTPDPRPNDLAELAGIIHDAKSWSDDYVAHWMSFTERLSGEPSYQRCAQLWAATIELDTSDKYRPNYIIDQIRNSPLPPLSDEIKGELGQALEEANTLAAEPLRSLARQLSKLSKRIGERGFPSAAYRTYRSLDAGSSVFRSAGYDADASTLYLGQNNIDRHLTLNYLRTFLQQNPDVELADHMIGHYVSPFKVLKLKPKTLDAEPSLSKPSVSTEKTAESSEASKKDDKPRRPIRLSEAEAAAHMAENTEEFENNPEYQSFDALIEAGVARGAQIGNWVPQKERPALVKNNLDAIKSLADILQMSPSLFALGDPIDTSKKDKDGELVADAYTGKEGIGLAFGARGRSKAAAHYEPGLHVINLTRLKGLGSLSHEWMHGLDQKLGNLLDGQTINGRYHPKDVKRVTLNNRITTFSEYIACYWHIATILGNRGSLDSIPAMESHLENRIRRDIRSDIPSETIDEVMPLLMGISRVLREVYHRRPSPAEAMEEVADDFSTLLARTIRHATEAPTFSNDVKTAMLDAVPDEKDLITGWYSRLQKVALSVAPMDQFAGIEHLLHYVTNAVAETKTKHLSQQIKRDLRDNDRDQIVRWISLGINYHVREALFLADAAKRLDQLNYPPLPPQLEFDRSKNWRVHEGQFKAAIKETIYQAPQEYLNELASNASLFNIANEQTHELLQNLSPTDMGVKAGQKKLNVFDDPSGTAWLAEARTFIASGDRSFRTKYPVSLAPLRAMYDVSETPPARTLSRIHENIGHELSVSRDALTKSEPFVTARFTNQLRNGYRDICVAKGQYGSAVDDLTDDEVHDYFRNLDTISDLSYVNEFVKVPLLLNSLFTAHNQSKFNDGSATSLALSYLNPERLKDDLPNNFFSLASSAFYEKRESANSKNPLLSFEQNSAEIRTIIRNGFMSGPGARSARLSRLSLGMSNYLQDIDSQDLPSDDMLDETAKIFSASVYHDDLSGVQALDAFIDTHSTSLRYKSAAERVELIAELYPEARDEITELLHPNQFHDALISEIPETSPVSISAKRYIEVSQGHARKHHQIPKETRDQIHAINRVGNRESLPVSHPCFVSNFLRDSASFEGGKIRMSGECNAKGRKYWSETVEIFARSFEKLVHEALIEKGKPNPFLVTVPTNETQIEALKHTCNDDGNRVHGRHYALAYPAGHELKMMKAHFDKDVIPNMERALSTLYPKSIPHYEAYIARKAKNDVAKPVMKVERNVQELTNRLMPQLAEENVAEENIRMRYEANDSPTYDAIDPNEEPNEPSKQQDVGLKLVPEQPTLGF